MRIIVRNEDVKLWLPIPTAWIFNDFAAIFASRAVEQYGMTMTVPQARKLMRTIRECNRIHRGLTLLEAESADGGYVKIKL